MTSLRTLAFAFELLSVAVACRPVARTTEAGGARDAGAAALDASALPAHDAGADAGRARDAGSMRLRAKEEVGPFERPFAGQRNVYYVRAAKDGRARLVANLHGVCNPPGYACGFWVNAGSAAGVLVCPEGNARCGPQAASAPTWKESSTR